MITMDSEKLKKFHQLTESFINEVEKMNLDEGFMDTAKAKWAGLKGGIKGFGKQIQGNVNKTTGDILNKGVSTVAKGLGGDPSKSSWAKSAQNLSKKGASQIDIGKNLAYNEKYNSYLNNTVNTIVNDLQNLNINVSDKNKLVNDLKKSITTNTKQPTKPLAGTPAAATSNKPIAGRTATPSNTPSVTPSSPATAKSNKPIAGSSTEKPVTNSKAVPNQNKKMLGSKGLPKILQHPPKGTKLSLSGRELVSADAQQIAQPEKQSQMKDAANAIKNTPLRTEKPKNTQVSTEKSVDTTHDASKKKAIEKVKSNIKTK